LSPVYDLFGKTRADVMAPLTTRELWAARLDGLGFWLFEAGIVGITWIFFLGDLLMTGRLLFIGTAAVYDRLQEKIFGKACGSRIVPQSCGAHSRLQRRESDCAHHARRA
jgi:hypothetical protein